MHSLGKFWDFQYLDNITIRDELGLKTFGAASEQFQGVAGKSDCNDYYYKNQQQQQCDDHDRPEAATAVKVFEVACKGMILMTILMIFIGILI